MLNGGDGNDTVTANIDQAVATPSTPSLQSVESVKVTTTGAAAVGLNLVNATGVTSVEIQNINTAGNMTVSALDANTALAVSNTQNTVIGNNVNTFVYKNAAVAGSADAATLTLNNVGTAAGTAANNSPTVVLTGGAGSASGVEALTIDATGNARVRLSVVNDAAGANAQTATSVTVKGTGNLTIDALDFAGTGAVARTFDASAATGNVNVTFTDVGATGEQVAATGGAGNDRFAFAGTLDTNDNVKGGAGRDTLAVTNEATIVQNLKTESIEIVEVGSIQAGQTLALSRVSGADSVLITGAQNAAGTITGLVSGSNLEFRAGGNGLVTATVTNATNAGTNDTLNLVLNHNGGQNVSGGLAIAGVENVSISSVKQNASVANNTNQFAAFTAATAPQLQNITITGDQNLTLNGGLNAQVKTVKATDFTGDLNVTIQGGVANNGVAITGGSGDDIIRGGSSNDVIVTGNGANVVQGDVLGVVQAGTAQQSTLTVGGAVETGDVFSATIAGQVVTFTATAPTAANVETGLVAAINGNATLAAAGITAAAANADGVVVINGNANGTAFNITSATANNRQAGSEQTTVALAATYDVGDVVRVTINGTNYDHTVAGGAGNNTLAAVAAGLKTLIDSGTAMTATVTGTGLTLTGVIPGFDYTVAASMATNQANTANIVTITPTGLAATEFMSVTIGGTTYSTVYATDVATTLGNFVTAHKAAIDTATGGALAATATALTITNANGAAPTGGTITAAVTGGDGGSASVVTTQTGITTTAHAAPTVTANSVAPVTQGADNTQALTSATTTAAVAQVVGAGGADTITLGSGYDAVQIGAGESGFIDGAGLIQVDTIVGLNFGGNGATARADVIDLLADGADTGLVANNADIATAANFNNGATMNVINGGVAQAMSTAPTLTAAVQALFLAGGALNAQANTAGLFTYGTDTYLVVAGGAAGAYNAADDIVIKVTGVSGTFDVSDLV